MWIKRNFAVPPAEFRCFRGLCRFVSGSILRAMKDRLTMILTRTALLRLLLATMVAVTHVSFAAAKDGGESSGSGSSGSGSSSGHGSGGDRSGDDHSGRGGGDDHDDDDDHGDDDRGDDEDDDDSDYARDAVSEGRILPLKSVLKRIDAKRYGKVIDVRVRRSFFRDVYQIKVRDPAGAIRTIRVDAKRGTILGDD